MGNGVVNVELINFVRARLDEREASFTDDWRWAAGLINGANSWEERDIAAKRVIVDEYEACVTNSAVNKLVIHALEWTVEKLAAIDSDHPDCDPKWRRTTT